MRRVFALSTREQLLVFEELRAYLGGPAAQPESGLEKEIAAREAALAAMRAVAAHLGRPEGAYIKVREYDAAAGELGLDVSSKQVRDAWGRWREATRVFAGGQGRESPAQRSQRRDSSGKVRKYETPLTALHEWLTDEHGIGGGRPVSFQKPDYDEYRKARNAKVKGSPLLPSGGYIVRLVGLVWDDCVACARGEADAEQLREQRASEPSDEKGPLGLIGGGDVARMLGLALLDENTRKQSGFPIPVAVVGGLDAWVSEDVRAYQKTGKAPAREPGSYQAKLVDLADAAEILGYHVDTLRRNISTKSGRTPMPEGRVARHHYWRRETIENWKRPSGRR